MSAPIRVAHVMGKMVGGGVEAVVMNYYRHIDRDKVQFDFLVDEDSTLVPGDEIESLGGRVFVVPPYQRLPRYMRELERLFRQERWPVVHSHVNALSVFPLCAAKRAGVPVRVAHSHSTSGNGELAKNAIKAALRPFANVYPTHRLACSDYAGRWLFGSAADFAVLRNAFDVEMFRFDAEARLCMRAGLGVRDEMFAFGHAGRFCPQKNQAWLIQRFAALAKHRADAVLVLAGSGPDRVKCERLASELGVGERVLFVGQVVDMSAFYSAVDCFLLPSAYEGLGLVAVEAQAAGLPCVVSDGVPKVVDVTGNVVFISLEDEMCWESLMASAESRPNRSLTSSELKALATYDITVWASKLTVYYASLVCQAVEGAHAGASDGGTLR